MLNYDISRMRERVTFGTLGTYLDPETHQLFNNKFKPVFTVWCGPYTQTQSQIQTALGLKIELDAVIVIRHTKKVNSENVFAKYRGKLYKVLSIDSDERLNAFDIISMVKAPKDLPEE